MCCKNMVIRGLLLIAMLQFSDMASAADDSVGTNKPTLCEVTIEGESIESVVLVALKNQREINVPRNKKQLKLPPGQYAVRQVTLQGDFSYFDYVDTNPFELKADEPYTLQVGAPLTPTLQVKRRGKYLTLDLQLLDAGGRNYSAPYSDEKPGFTVYQGQREIGSGQFEYG